MGALSALYITYMLSYDKIALVRSSGAPCAHAYALAICSHALPPPCAQRTVLVLHACLQVEVVCGSMGNALGSVGGWCVGTTEVRDP